MKDLCQGDIVKVSGFPKKLFVIISKNAFIKATGVFHICPLLLDVSAGPLHILIKGKEHTEE